MKILHLNLKKKWFDMIDAGIKTEEYREDKYYWWQRLADFTETPAEIGNIIVTFKFFDAVVFKNGYAKGAPEMKFKVQSISLGTGNYKWGAEPGKKYFVIKLGDRI